MPETLTRKGAFWSFCIFDLLSGKQTVNGAIVNIDFSRECLLVILEIALGKTIDTPVLSFV